MLVTIDSIQMASKMLKGPAEKTQQSSPACWTLARCCSTRNQTRQRSDISTTVAVGVAIPDLVVYSVAVFEVIGAFVVIMAVADPCASERVIVVLVRTIPRADSVTVAIGCPKRSVSVVVLGGCQYA